jgi:hypothetical protein
MPDILRQEKIKKEKIMENRNMFRGQGQGRGRGFGRGKGRGRGMCRRQEMFQGQKMEAADSRQGYGRGRRNGWGQEPS